MIFLAGFVCGGLSVLGAGVYYLAKDTPRGCKCDCGCIVGTWSESGFCSLCEIDECQEELGLDGHGNG